MVVPFEGMTPQQILTSLQVSMVGFLLIILFLLTQVRRKHQQHERDTAGQYVLMIEDFREELLDLHKKLAKQQHEIRHQVEYAEKLLRLEDGKPYDKLEVPLKTGNVIIDTVIHTKQAELREGVTLNVKGNVSNALGFDTLDLVLVVMNLLENSIEACNDLSEAAAIDMNFVYTPAGLIIEIKNPTIERKAGSLFYSSKKGLNHGFGLSIVYSLIDRYNGYHSVEIENGYFTIKVLIQESENKGEV